MGSYRSPGDPPDDLHGEDLRSRKTWVIGREETRKYVLLGVGEYHDIHIGDLQKLQKMCFSGSQPRQSHQKRGITARSGGNLGMDLWRIGLKLGGCRKMVCTRNYRDAVPNVSIEMWLQSGGG